MVFDLLSALNLTHDVHHHDHHHHSHAHAVSFAATPAAPAANEDLNDDPLAKELDELRSTTLRTADINSAQAWGKKMRTLQDDCFDKQSDKSCRLMNRELGKASELFSELAQATKTASQDAMGLLSPAAASAGSKMQGINMAGLALTLLMPTRKVNESSNSADFL